MSDAGRALLLAVLIGLLTPVAAGAQDALPTEAAVPSSPLELLLEQRGSLGLTPEQLTRLDEIREQLAATNEPLVTRMMSLRTQWQRERRVARRGGREQDTARIERIRADAARIRTRIQNNNRTAMRQVNRVLMPQQRTQLRAIIEERRQQQRGRRAGGGSNAGDGN
jgi:hypothetical protein